MRIPREISVAAIVVAALALAACGAVVPTGSSSSSGAALEPSPAVTGPGPSAPTMPPTTAPTPEPLVLGGIWVRPKPRATLTEYKTRLSARPTATGEGMATFTNVTFFAAADGVGKKFACEATKPGKNGVWSCKANLVALGVPPGMVTFRFDVRAVGMPVAHSPDGPRQATYAVPPPRPSNTRLKQLEPIDWEGGDTSAVLHRVRWSAPAGYADEFLVYETFDCPRPSTKENANKPCFVRGTRVDTSQLELRAKAAGDARSVEFDLAESECTGDHGTILLVARNAYGKSVYAIVKSALVIWVPPGDQVC